MIKNLFVLPVIFYHGFGTIQMSRKIRFAIFITPFLDAFIRNLDVKLQSIRLTPNL